MERKVLDWSKQKAVSNNRIRLSDNKISFDGFVIHELFPEMTPWIRFWDIHITKRMLRISDRCLMNPPDFEIQTVFIPFLISLFQLILKSFPHKYHHFHLSDKKNRVLF